MEKDIEEMRPSDIHKMSREELVSAVIDLLGRMMCVRGQLEITVGYLEIASRDQKTSTH